MRFNLIFLYLLLTVSVRADVSSVSVCDLNQNAALKYWQAFATMPKANPEDHVFGESTADKLTDVTKQFVNLVGSADALENLRKGAALPRCAWGLNVEDGPGMRVPHLSQARMLVRIAAFHFRLACEVDVNSADIDDLSSALVLSRHVGTGCTIEWLVGISSEEIVIDQVAPDLPRLRPDVLIKLAERLDRLPSFANTSDVICWEKSSFLNYFQEGLKRELGKGENAQEALRILSGVFGEDPDGDLIKAIPKLLFEELGNFYDEQSKVLALPLKDMSEMQTKLDKRIFESTNPLVKLILPVCSRLYAVKIRQSIRYAMFRASIAVLLNGHEQLKNYPDPVDGEIFGYRVFKGGFELVSRQKNQNGNKDEPVHLIVGQEKK